MLRIQVIVAYNENNIGSVCIKYFFSFVCDDDTCVKYEDILGYRIAAWGFHGMPWHEPYARATGCCSHMRFSVRYFAFTHIIFTYKNMSKM